MVNANKEINSVIDTLKKEYGCYKDMLELSKSKRKIIIEGKVADLDKIVKLEQNMILNIGQLEKKREEEVAKLCDALGVTGGQITVSELAEALQADQRNELEKVQNELQELLYELKAVNDLNGELLKQSIEYIDYSINLISGAGMETGSLYEDMGKGKRKASKKNLFDTKV